MPVRETLKQTQEKMEKTLRVLQQELQGIRTGMASPALLDLIRVEAYGTVMPLNQLATISAPEPRLLVVQPYDKNNIPFIEKAIRASDLALNPSNDGTLIRIPIPPLSEERREELVRMLHRLVEESRVAVRNERRQANEAIKALEKDHEISEDESYRAQDRVQKLTDEYIEKIDRLLERKEKEVRET